MIMCNGIGVWYCVQVRFTLQDAVELYSILLNSIIGLLPSIAYVPLSPLLA